MFSMLLVSIVAFLPWFPGLPNPSPGGVSRATFEKIRIGMTKQEVHTLIGRKCDSGGGYLSGAVSETIEDWYDKGTAISVDYAGNPFSDEPPARVRLATFHDNSTTPATVLWLQKTLHITVEEGDN
jgi:hypothetical protein